MYTVSVWASRHLWPSRIAIVLLYCVFTVLAFFVGAMVHLSQITIPVLFFYAAAGLFLAVFSMYPQRQQKHRFRHFYRYQKRCDAILIGTTFFFIVCIGNQPQKLLRLGVSLAAASVVLPATGVVETPNITTEKNLKKARLFKKSGRRLLIQKIQVLRKIYKETSKGGKVALIILAILVAFGLCSLLAALSCSLACSGSDGLAVLVGVLGAGLITFLLIHVILRIERGPKHRTKEMRS